MASGTRDNDILKTYGIQINNVPRPRAPPMFFRPPTPLVMERPQPLVSDVSLIIDSACTSMHSAAGSFAGDTKEEQFRNLASTNEVTLPSQRSSDIRHVNEVTPNMNFANYFPTPPSESATPRRDVETSRSHSKDDSGRGTSALSSLPNNVQENDDDTIASGSLDEEVNNVTSNVIFQSEDIKMLKSDVASILKLVSQQQETIDKLNKQVSTILVFQGKIWTSLQKSSTLTKEVQTDEVQHRKESDTRITREESPKLGSPGHDMQKQPLQNKAQQEPRSRQSLPSSSNLRTSNSNPRSSKNAKEGTGVTNSVDELQETVVQSSTGDRNIEDFSTLLKHLQFSNAQDPSMYSQTSIKPVEFSQFNDESFHNNEDSCIGSPCIGPSVSECGSASDDEPELHGTPQPTVTYYNNLLTTVNKFLDSGQRKRLTGTSKMRTTPENVANPCLNAVASVPAPVACSRASTVSYSSSGSSCDEHHENRFLFQNNYTGAKSHPAHNPNVPGLVGDPDSNNVVDVTKRYLRSIGANFDSPTPNAQERDSVPSSTIGKGGQHQQNYMIQQNVYNSIYIPTVNCVPVVSDSLNSNSGFIENLANKYIPPADLNQYELLTNKNVPTTETTVYGMSPSNLSFATKQYLQRYGLVSQAPMQNNHVLTSSAYNIVPTAAVPNPAKIDRILDITAIRNQPKLL